MISQFSRLAIMLALSLALVSCGTATVTTGLDNQEASPEDGVDDGEDTPGDEAPGVETGGPIGKAPLSKTPAMESKDPPSAEDLACETDEDCVPAECCHPKTCVNKGARPNCEGMMCTMDCRGGTMDCGGGNCVCQDGKCATHMNAPKIPGALKPPQKIE